MWDDCHSETALFLTTAGNIYCNRMYSDSKICIKDQVHYTTHYTLGVILFPSENDYLVSRNGPNFF